MSDLNAYQEPRWIRDLLRFLPLKSQFVLSGNISDLQVHAVSEGVVTAVTLDAALNEVLRNAGYASVITFNPVSGFRPLAAADEPYRLLDVSTAWRPCGSSVPKRRHPPDFRLTSTVSQPPMT